MPARSSAKARWEAVPRPILAFEAALLVVLLFGYKCRFSLGFPVLGSGLEQVLMVGMLVVAAGHLTWLVSALAEQAGSTGLGKSTWPFFVLPLVLYLVILPWSTTRRELDGDEPYYLLITHSLAYDFDTELTNNYSQKDSLRFVSRVLEPEWADPVRADGRAFSRHSLLLPLLLVPGYLIGGKSGAVITMALLTALASWLAFRLARRYWPERQQETVWAWALLSLTPPLLLYSHQIWVEVPAMILLLIGLGQICALEQATSRPRRAWLILASVVVLLPILKLRLILLTGPLLALAWWRAGRSRMVLVRAAIGLTLMVGGLLVFNQMTTGKWFRDHSVDLLVRIQTRHPGEYLQGATGLLWDCAFGLFATNPAWLMVIPALLLVIWRRQAIAADMLVLGLPYLAIIAPRGEWYGAWSPPFRFGMVLLPLLAMALVPLLAGTRRAGAQMILTGSLALGAVVSLLWLVEPGWTYNLATGTNHVLDHLASLWGVDAARFFPSLVRLRTASWLVPPLVGGAVLVFWWWPQRRAEWQGAAIAMLLLAVAALPLVARSVPTRVVEIEDHQVNKQGGTLFPEPWVPLRRRYRGGWRMLSGDSISAPVVAGGSRVSIELELMAENYGEKAPPIALLAGDRILAADAIEEIVGWQTVSWEGLDWLPGAPLKLVLGSDGLDDTAGGAVIFDRVNLRWD